MKLCDANSFEMMRCMHLHTHKHEKKNKTATDNITVCRARGTWIMFTGEYACCIFRNKASKQPDRADRNRDRMRIKCECTRIISGMHHAPPQLLLVYVSFLLCHFHHSQNFPYNHFPLHHLLFFFFSFYLSFSVAFTFFMLFNICISYLVWICYSIIITWTIFYIIQHRFSMHAHVEMLKQ